MIASCLIAVVLLGADSITLRDTPPAAAHVVIEMTAQGHVKPPAMKGQPEPKPLPIKVQSRLDFIERPLPGGRVARRVSQAAVAINSPKGPMPNALRPEVSTLVVERRDGSLFTFSPGGPLTRSELDLIQGPADPLTLPSLLPDGPAAVGQTWEIGDAVAKALSDYEALASSTLRGKLVALDDATATIRIAGEVRGAVRGGEGTVTLDGTLTFDRQASLITALKLDRAEVRKPGQVEAGLDLKGTVTVERSATEVPPELADAVLTAQPLDPSGGLAMLQLAPAVGRYTLLHDRDWHLVWDDTRQAVLKRLDRGELLAQCNLSVGPNAGKGRHQDPAQFRDDIREALGSRFAGWVGAGEIDRDDGGYAYKVAVRGKEGEQEILWYYYLLASPEGDQLLATFTLNAADADRFGDQDGQLVGSLQWKAAGER